MIASPQSGDVPPPSVFLSVIIPCYNEQQNIRCTLDHVLSYLADRSYTWEVLVIDDGSVDRAVEIVRELLDQHEQLELVECMENRGKGAAIRRGMLEARGQARLFLDADYSGPIEESEKMLPLLEEGADVVIGTRTVPESEIQTIPPFHRHVLGEVYRKLSNFILVGGISDFNCGFKLFSARAGEDLFRRQKIDGWAFDSEVLFLAVKLGYTVREVPIRWAHKQSTSKVHAIRDGIKSFLALLKIRWNYMRGRYDSANER